MDRRNDQPLGICPPRPVELSRVTSDRRFRGGSQHGSAISGCGSVGGAVVLAGGSRLRQRQIVCRGSQGLRAGRGRHFRGRSRQRRSERDCGARRSPPYPRPHGARFYQRFSLCRFLRERRPHGAPQLGPGEPQQPRANRDFLWGKPLRSGRSRASPESAERHLLGGC